MTKHKQTKATDISPRVREQVLNRDGRMCILCGRPWYLEIAHYVGRAQGGLGIPENLVTLCKNCHMEYDNGDYREIHGKSIHDYLKSWYPKHDETKLTYDKYGWLNEIKGTTED